MIAESLSVVMPVWNEADVVEDVLGDVERDILSRYPGDAEVIVVDDRSTDGSEAILDRLAADKSWLRVVHAQENRGHGPSVRAGLELAGGDWIFQLDSDGHFVTAEFWALWEQRDHADLVLGVRSRRRDPRHRLLLSRAVNLATSVLAGRRLSDANAPFRLFRRSVWVDLRPVVGDRALAPSILIALGAAARGWRIAEVPVTHRASAGGSSLRRLRLVRFSLHGLGQLLAFRLRLLRAARQ